jgi:hypothetical protein
LELAEGTLLGLNTAMMYDTKPWGIYTGCPAKLRNISSKDFTFL